MRPPVQLSAVHSDLPDASKCWCIDITELMVLVFKITGDANHRCIVGCITEFGNINCPTIALRMVMKSISQTVVCTHTTGNRYMSNTRFLHRHP